MDKLDTWLHVVELIIAVIVVPSIRQLVSTLVMLHQQVGLLAQSVKQHSDAFQDHLTEDRKTFEALDMRLSAVDGSLREVRGMLHVYDRRNYS